MAWTKSPQSLIDLFDKSVPSSVTVSRRKMFGYPAAFANGNLFIGLHQNDFIMRLSEEDRARFSAEYGERVFEPMKGRPMREYVRLPEELLTDARRQTTVKKFVLLHYGFEKPTPEIMAAWGKWFQSMKDRIIDMGGHFSGGREISKAGTKDLPLGLESITGFTIVSADSIDDAEKIAQSNPYISSIRIYEVMSK